MDRTWMCVGLVATALLAGCDPYDVLTEQEQITIRLTSLEAPGYAGLSKDRPILQGSRTVSEWERNANVLSMDTNLSRLEDCFDVSVEPDVGVLGGVLDFEEPGPVVWSFEAVPCAGIAEGEHVDDRLELEVISPDDVTVARHFPHVAEAERLLALEDDRTRFELADGLSEIPAWMTPTDEPLRVLNGGTATLQAEVLDADGRYVMVGDGVGGLEVRSLPGERDTPLSIRVTPEAEGTATLSFEAVGLDEDLGQVQIVSPDVIDHLEFLALDELDNENGSGGTYGVIAVPVDDEGRRLFGAPIEWTLIRGASLPLGPSEGEEPGPPDDAPLAPINPGDCIQPSERLGTHTSVLRARTFGHSDTVTLSWTYTEEAVGDDALSGEADATWTQPVECVSPTRGCGCASTSTPTGWLAGLGLLGGLLVRRRRRR